MSVNTIVHEPQAGFFENFSKSILGCRPATDLTLEATNIKDGCNNFKKMTDELKFGVAVAESHSEHTYLSMTLHIMLIFV